MTNKQTGGYYTTEGIYCRADIKHKHKLLITEEGTTLEDLMTNTFSRANHTAFSVKGMRTKNIYLTKRAKKVKERLQKKIAKRKLNKT